MNKCWIAFVSALSCFTCHAEGRQWMACIVDELHIPFSSLDRSMEAPGQILVRRAFEKEGDRINFMAFPWKRALLNMGDRGCDLLVGASAAKAYMDFISFPLKNNAPDTGRALGFVTYKVVRLPGSKVNWDGKKFMNLSTPVLYPPGAASIESKLAQLGVRGNDSVRKPVQLLRMLLRNHAEIALMRDQELGLLLKDAEFGGRFEVLPASFIEWNGYLGVRRKLYENEPAFFENIWTTIGRLNNDTEVKKTMKELLDAMQRRDQPPAPQ